MKEKEEKVIEVDFRPDIRLSDIIGQPKAKEAAQKLIMAIEFRHLYDMYGITTSKGTLLYGPPGTGKSMLAEAIATEAGAGYASIAMSDIGSMYINQTSNKFVKLMTEYYKAMDKNNMDFIVFMDEFDGAGSARRNSPGSSREGNKLVNTINQYLSGDKAKDGMYFIAATNFVGALDKAVTRSGRFDTWVKFEDFDQQGIKDLYHHYMVKRNIIVGYDVFNLDKVFWHNQIVKASSGFNGADVENIVRGTLEQKLYDNILNPELTEDQIIETFQVNRHDLLSYINKHKESRGVENKKRKIGFLQ